MVPSIGLHGWSYSDDVRTSLPPLRLRSVHQRILCREVRSDRLPSSRCRRKERPASGTCMYTVKPASLLWCFISQESSSRKCKCLLPFIQVIPPYNGFGSLEDTLQSCISLIPQPPKKDFIRMLENDNKVLRYSAVLVCGVLSRNDSIT